MVSGIVFLDKPQGWTSRRAVNEVARLFGGSGRPRLKAGHAGTLDPMATGMLPILLGEATRFAELGLSAEKTDAVTIDLSYQTDTLDAEGETLARFTERTILDRAQLFAQLESITQNGYAADNGEFLDEVASVAVPIRDYTRSGVGSLAVIGPAYRVSEERIASETAQLVMEA